MAGASCFVCRISGHLPSFAPKARMKSREDNALWKEIRSRSELRIKIRNWNQRIPADDKRPRDNEQEDDTFIKLCHRPAYK